MTSTTTPATLPSAPDGHGDRPRRVAQRRPPSDRLFRGVWRLGGALVLVIMLLVGSFLAYQGWEALKEAGWSFFTTQAWDPGALNFGVAGVLPNGVLIALVAIVVAVPLSTGAALYISEYARGWLQRTLISLVDLMAAVPSVVYGLWGFFLLQPQVLVNGPQGDGLPRWLATYFGWLPLFKVDGWDRQDPLGSPTVFTASAFIAGLTVSMMVTPIITSVMREVFSQAPIGEREGAYALGATKWGMIRGSLNTATVVDLRGSNAGWDLTGISSDFTGPGTITATNLGWEPTATKVSGSGTVTPGATVTPATGGLATPRSLATAASGSSAGSYQAAGGLTLSVPDTANSGNYNATLTLTLA